MDGDEALAIVMCAVPQELADDLARHLVELRLAACVQRIAPIRSTYRWEGQVEQADEALLLAKTAASCAAAVTAAIAARHPYAVPEILTLPVDAALPSYLRWVIEETAG
ncbi:MAG: divalent-cation tolerance protein CutA [Planctomycetota bacterium]